MRTVQNTKTEETYLGLIQIPGDEPTDIIIKSIKGSSKGVINQPTLLHNKKAQPHQSIDKIFKRLNCLVFKAHYKCTPAHMSTQYACRMKQSSHFTFSFCKMICLLTLMILFSLVTSNGEARIENFSHDLILLFCHQILFVTRKT